MTSTSQFHVFFRLLEYRLIYHDRNIMWMNTTHLIQHLNTLCSRLASAVHNYPIAVFVLLVSRMIYCTEADLGNIKRNMSYQYQRLPRGAMIPLPG